jgi:hypothetical protein
MSRHDAAVAINAEGGIFPQGRRESGKDAKLREKVKAGSFSEVRA